MIKVATVVLIWACLSTQLLLGQTASTGIAFQQSNSLSLPSGSGFSFIFYDVPAGKRLVIDYVSAWADLTLGERLRFQIQTTVDANTVDYRLVYSASDNSDGSTSLVANQAMRICADGGTRVILQVFRDKPLSSGKAGFAISGTLVGM